ncbi:MAG: hypothetical protein N2561_01580 [Bacteroidetes bacterium]|nr:hypothetical protein [Rhodothermia bacterium]MCS7155159.1 hypothetical protein [Bacteroidota bacterium]MCX7906214.1 hypothetical protein [Bacteroidota bacterium]MDW8138341.1 hypothetical protein [Bacteroidota bacterium]MDW8286026.1 hypothetical protein [Bacteroidota bacterium]
MNRLGVQFVSVLGIALAVGGFLWGCLASGPQPASPLFSEPLAPGRCRLLGQLERVEAEAAGQWMVTMRVERVLGYGMAFPAPIAQGVRLRLPWPSSLGQPASGERWEVELEALEEGAPPADRYRLLEARRRS